ncbi:MAG: hypothetical protein HRU09_20660 [Oligoflexales bacterium]|nr:hypothetical protein [Oligoflexales bacterium]
MSTDDRIIDREEVRKKIKKGGKAAANNLGKTVAKIGEMATNTILDGGIKITETQLNILNKVKKKKKDKKDEK